MRLLTYQGSLENLIRERTEKLEEASSKAEAASQAKSRFLANMSHGRRSQNVLGRRYGWLYHQTLSTRPVNHNCSGMGYEQFATKQRRLETKRATLGGVGLCTRRRLVTGRTETMILRC